MNDYTVEAEGDASKPTFLRKCVRVALSKLIALKPIRPEIKRGGKYQQILTSVREVGLVEPPVVKQAPHKKGGFFILDGHLRVEALREIGVSEVDCLVAVEDDTYTYNKHVNRLSAVQNHRMASSATNQAVTNILEAFFKVKERDGALAGRWLDEIKSYGLYLPAFSRTDTFEFPVQELKATKDGFVFDAKKYENKADLEQARKKFLSHG